MTVGPTRILVQESNFDFTKRYSAFARQDVLPNLFPGSHFPLHWTGTLEYAAKEMSTWFCSESS